MDFLNPLATQLRGLYDAMTPAARITTGLLLAVVVVSFAMLFQQSGAGPDDYLFGGEPLASSQIQRMEAAIAQAGLAGAVADGNRLRVPAGRKDEFLAAIAAADALPPDFASMMDDALDKANPFESREQWLQRTKAAREKQLAHIIGLMPWVEYSTVMYEVTPRMGLSRSDQAAASVFVMPVVGESLDKGRLRAIQRLVAGWNPSLTPDRVTVTSGSGDAADSSVLFDDPYLSIRHEFERAKRADILNAISYIDGVRVQVNAVFDNLVEKQVSEVRPQSGQAVREQKDKEDTTSATTSGGGQPGLDAQGPSRTGRDAALARETRTTSSRTKSDTENTVGYINETARHAGYVPKEVFAAIAVPRDYLLDVWRKGNPDKADQQPDPTELSMVENGVRTTIENLVEPLLPRLPAGKDEWEGVAVSFFDAVLPAPPEPASFASTALGWLTSHGSTLTLVGLAAVSLLMLRSATRPQADRDSAAGAVIELAHATAGREPSHGTVGDSDGDEVEDDARPRLRLKKGKSLTEDLTAIVREDPDAAAAILRGWIGKAG